MTKKHRIECDQAINEIAEVLCRASGKDIAEVYQLVTGKLSKYDISDSLIEVEDIGEGKT